MAYSGTGYDEYYNGQITVDSVNAMQEPSDRFLCPINANIYDMDFTGFVIRTIPMYQGVESKILFQVAQPPGLPPPSQRNLTDSSRQINYRFPGSFIHEKFIGTTLQFTNGPHEAHNFRMVERHYFDRTFLRGYDFVMPYVIPHTSNTWEMQYELPDLTDEWKATLYQYPGYIKSDTFIFVNDQLVMHLRATYSYDLPG